MLHMVLIPLPSTGFYYEQESLETKLFYGAGVECKHQPSLCRINLAEKQQIESGIIWRKLFWSRVRTGGEWIGEGSG